MNKLLLFLLLCLLPFTGFSDPVKDLISKSGGSAEFPNDHLLVLFDSTRVDVMETGLSHFHIRQLTKVLTQQGALRMKAVKYGYDPLSAFVELKKVLIHKKSGETRELNLKKVLDYPAPARAIYWGAREIMIEVGRLEPGDAVEVIIYKKGFTYALLQTDDEQYIPPMRGHFYDIVPFYSGDPYLVKVYDVYMPKDKPLQFEFYHGECTSKLRFLPEKTFYSFSMKNFKPLKPEPAMVAWDDVAPKLLLSTSPDWEAKSLWFYKVNEDYKSFDPTPEARIFVSELLKGAKSELDSISILTHWVADHMRYSGISMGKGEGYTLHSCAMNFTDRCGVCKDKASLLIAFLRAAGFESYPAMTMAGSRIEDIPADQFNHSVTVVKRRSGQYELLDPTWVPFVRELWSSAEQQQNYLMGVPEGADLMITPVSPPENHYFRMNVKSKLDKNGNLAGTLEVTAEGQSDAAVRGLFTRNYQADWNMLLERELLKIYPTAKVKSMSYGEPYNHMAAPILIKISFEIPGFAIDGSNTLFFNPLTTTNLFIAGMPYLGMSTNMESRKFGFRDRTSRLVELNETIELPEGMKVKHPSEAKEINGSFNSGNFSWSHKNNILTITQSSTFRKRVYESEDWTDFKKCVEAQKGFGAQPFIGTF